MKLPLTALFITLATTSITIAGTYPQWDGTEPIVKYATRAKLEPTLTLDMGGGLKWEGVLIPAGTFVMGSPPGEAKTQEQSANEKRHKVTITKPFYLGKFELTQAQYQKVMGENPSKAIGEDLPVHNVTWQNAQDFCDKLGKQLGREVQLPTEAQWEYACRAGTTTTYHSGDTIADLEKAGWFNANSGGKPHPGGQKLPNAWGVYDMHGNIREFTRDLFKDAPLADAVDPTGPTEGDPLPERWAVGKDPKNHVVRGGAYSAVAAVGLNCRAALRKGTEALEITGFRIMVGVPK